MPAAIQSLPIGVKIGAGILVILVAIAGGIWLINSPDGLAKSSHDYPEASKKAFMDNCLRTSGSRRDYCQCALDELQERYTYREFADIERDIQATGSAQRTAEEKLIAVVDTCQR